MLLLCCVALWRMYQAEGEFYGLLVVAQSAVGGILQFHGKIRASVQISQSWGSVILPDLGKTTGCYAWVLYPELFWVGSSSIWGCSDILRNYKGFFVIFPMLPSLLTISNFHNQARPDDAILMILRGVAKILPEIGADWMLWQRLGACLQLSGTRGNMLTSCWFHYSAIHSWDICDKRIDVEHV